MTNERSGGREDDGAFDGEADEDRTVVLVAEDFVVGAVRRLGSSLQRAGLGCDGAAELLRSGAGVAAIDDIDADLEDVERMIAGARRALARVRRGLVNRTASKETR